MEKIKTYYSHGKLLLTAEYTVLDNALAIGLPAKFGQSLEVMPTPENQLVWESYNKEGRIWFKTILSLDFQVVATEDKVVTNRLVQIFKVLKQLKPTLFETDLGWHFKTHLEFDAQWGLGTSSTLINNLANWAGVNPYDLLGQTFGGSGYDIACAKAQGPIFFQRTADGNRAEPIDFNPTFSNQLFFVYLNQKKNSREAIKHYKNLSEQTKKETIQEINTISQALLLSQTLQDFEGLINKHEALTSKLIQTPTIKSQLFADFNGTVKSLGAWGGDFVLATGAEDDVKTYFRNKGYDTILSYDEMILQ